MDYKISVIIPTIWSTDYIYESVEIMSKIDISHLLPTSILNQIPQIN